METDQLRRIAELVATRRDEASFTILGFFPEFRMEDFRVPRVEEMIEAYAAAKEAGLRNVRLGNIGIFARTRTDVERVLEATRD